MSTVGSLPAPPIPLYVAGEGHEWSLSVPTGWLLCHGIKAFYTSKI